MLQDKLFKYAIRISDEIDIAIQKHTGVRIKQKALEKKMDLTKKKSPKLDKELGITK